MSSLAQPVMGVFAYPRRKVNSDRTAKAALVLVRISANFLKDFVHLRDLWLKRQRLTTGDVHPNCRSLKERSLAANLRQELGHWEGALAVGKQNKATFVASVDRKSVSFLSRTPAMSRPPFGVTPGERRKFHLLAIGIAMALILRGGGKWSVDAAISRSLSER